MNRDYLQSIDETPSNNVGNVYEQLTMHLNDER